MKKAALCLVGAAALVATAAHAAPRVNPNEKDPRAIMKVALEQAAGASLARMKMTIRDNSGTRERVLNARSKRFDEGRKSLILIESPADLRNTGFLSIDYEGNRDDEQWLYLPKLHRTTRVPDSGKADPFVGSDFSYADMAQRNPDDFNLTLVDASAKVGDDECWLIEAVPKSSKIAKETGYSKSSFWISKNKVLPLQIKGTTTRGDTTKYFKASELRQVDGWWTPWRLQMRTLKGAKLQSETVIEMLSVDYDAQEVGDADFTRARLQRGI